MKKISVLVIDDSALMRKLLTDVIDADPRMEVVGVAVDPYDARDKIKKLSPDVLTLDIEMPKMNGITFLRNLMRLRPMPVVMVSTLTEKGATATLQSMELGALDYVAKSVLQEDAGLEKFATMVVDKVYMASKANVAALASSSRLRNEPPSQSRLTNAGTPRAGRIVAIGSSTGGTEALNQLLQVLRWVSSSKKMGHTQSSAIFWATKITLVTWTLKWPALRTASHRFRWISKLPASHLKS